jgi:CubicO group peptidase (beta-lactamase class C family)
MLRIAAAFAAVCSLAAQPFPALDRLGEAELARTKIPGLVMAVVKGDKVVYARGFGLANVETREPVTPDHLFRVGSTTKMMVAAAVVRLAELGKLKLDQPVAQYIPSIHPKLGAVTAEQLLSHTAGLWDRTLMYGPHDDAALAANVSSWGEDIFFTEPNKVISYSNMGYVVAGRLVEAVAGKPFADAVAELVWQPVGMTRTTFRPTLAMTYPLAQGHVSEKGKTVIARPAADHAGYWPAGSMFTSANEFARFAIAFLNQDRGLSRALVAELSKPRWPIPGPVAGKSYALGLDVDESGATPLIGHGGSRMGYTSRVLMAPAYQLAVVTIGNLSGGDASTLCEKAMELLLPVKAPPRREGPPTGANVAAYAGKYAQGPNEIELVAGDGKLKVKGREAALVPGERGCFVAERGTGSLCFTEKEGVLYVTQGLRAYRRK